MTKDPRIDSYIAKAAPFAQPILTHLRALTHKAVPDLTETLKWSMPHFVYKGKNLAGFAAFKAHASFWVVGEGREGEDRKSGGMGSMGKIASLADLPGDDELSAWIRQGKARIDAGKPAAASRPAKPPKAGIPMPEDFAAALDTGARATFDAFPPSARRDYLEWVTEAKRAGTRASRIAQAAEWIGDGKRRHWKYAKC